jgi:hypothetical protein
MIKTGVDEARKLMCIKLKDIGDGLPVEGLEESSSEVGKRGVGVTAR